MAYEAPEDVEGLKRTAVFWQTGESWLFLENLEGQLLSHRAHLFTVSIIYLEKLIDSSTQNNVKSHVCFLKSSMCWSIFTVFKWISWQVVFISGPRFPTWLARSWVNWTWNNRCLRNPFTWTLVSGASPGWYKHIKYTYIFDTQYTSYLLSIWCFFCLTYVVPNSYGPLTFAVFQPDFFFIASTLIVMAAHKR